MIITLFYDNISVVKDGNLQGVISLNFYLTNEHRRCMGLKPIGDNWDMVILKGKYGEEFYLFFDGDNIKKMICYQLTEDIILMHEMDINYQTKNNRTIILPKTNRGKEKNLNISALKLLDGEGNYFYINYTANEGATRVIIGNYTNQRTFFEETNISNCNSLDKFKEWCDNFAKNSTEEDIEEVTKFSREPRKHIKYKEGDYFRIKLGKNLYTYGRILMDIHKRVKAGMKYWDIFIGRTLIVETFHILTNRKDVSINELKKLKTFPSEHIMDNRFYYGDYEIIGNDKLPEAIKYPIMYGRSISAIDRDKIIFQCGMINKVIPYNGNNLIRREDEYENNLPNYDFRNSSSGFNITNDIETIKECIKEDSNNPYWEHYKYIALSDLRAPINKEKLKLVLKQMELEDLFKIYND